MTIYNKLDSRLLLPLADKFMKRDIHGSIIERTRINDYDRSEIDKIQSEKLVRLMRHCYNHVPYYKRIFDENGIDWKSIKKISDLTVLPILTKQTIRENYEEFISDDCQQRGYLHGMSGGSTGVPLKYNVDKASWNRFWAAKINAWGWSGYELGDKIFTLAGNSLVKTGVRRFLLSPKDLFDLLILRNNKRNCFDLTNDALFDHYHEMMRYSPSFIRGYASSLYYLARYMKENNFNPPIIKAIFTTGEKLHHQYRILIEEVFGAPVFDGYGAADGGALAFECESHKGLHVDESNCIIEIVDDNNHLVPDGVVGSVITTDLNNFAFPFLRYKVGDLSYFSTEQCHCGRKTKVLGEIIGREGRAIINKDGRPYSSIVIDNMMFNNHDYHSELNQKQYLLIDQFQIRQDRYGDIDILIKPMNPNERLTTFSYIVENFKENFPDSKINLLFVDTIPTLPSGKSDYCYSEYNSYDNRIIR